MLKPENDPQFEKFPVPAVRAPALGVRPNHGTCFKARFGVPHVSKETLSQQDSRISSTEILPFGVPYVSEPRRTITVCASRKRQALLEKNL